MKQKLLCQILLVAASAVYARAQEAKGSQTLTQPATKMPATMTAASPALTPSEKTIGQHITYGGYIIDVLKAKDKHALFDLKQPLDSQIDLQNLSFIPGADASSTVILFRIKH
jgi:hypothetical protein